MVPVIEEFKTETAGMEAQLKKAGEEHEEENKEFQLTVADQRLTQKLLQAALTVLKSFYEKSALLPSQPNSLDRWLLTDSRSTRII